MPFITQDRRTFIDREGPYNIPDMQPGDLCYFYYASMVRQWKANPRWTTAHEIYKQVMLNTRRPGVALMDDDELCARNLAWQVFFQLHVMKYEEQKRIANGDI